jgi:galactokinase
MNEALTLAFRSAFARDPEGAWTAPGRVNLVGEHTDYNGGLVLPIALSAGVTAAVRRRGDRLLKIASRQRPGIEQIATADLEPGSVSGWSAYVAGVIWALRNARTERHGFDILVDGDLPIGAGLSSSAALGCATALAIAELEDLRLDRWDLVIAAQRAEGEFVGVPTGIMDEAVSLLARAEHALFLDVRSRAIEHVPLQLRDAGLDLLVIDTGVHRSLAGGAYRERRRACEQAARELGLASLREIERDDLDDALARLSSVELLMRVRHVVTENARVVEAVSLMRAGRVADIGPLLSASHASLRDDYQVSSRELDLAVQAAMSAGALGARMTGGGFGGCAIALVERSASGRLGESVSAAFHEAGLARPEVFRAIPSGGARRVA